MHIIREKTVYQLAFLPRIFPINCYLVEEHDSFTLIDAALPYSSKGILESGRPRRKTDQTDFVNSCA